MKRAQLVTSLLCVVGCGEKKSAKLPPSPPALQAPLSPVTFDPPAGTVAAGTSVTLTAPGLPANGLVFYTVDGSDPTAGSAVAYAGPISINASETIQAYATAPGSGLADSVTSTAVYTVEAALAMPIIATVVTAGGAAVANAGSSPSFTVAAQNAPLTAILTAAAQSPTDTYFCVSLTHASPSCSSVTSGCAADDTQVIDGGTVSISADATTLAAVSCAAGTQSITETVTYNLRVTPLQFGVAVSTCGGSTSIGFDASALAADLAEGGPTVGASVCYGAPYNCGEPLPVGVSCFTPSAGSYSRTVTVTTTTLNAESCPPPGLVGQSGEAAISQTEDGVAAYSDTITISDPLLGHWSASSNLFSVAGGFDGGFSHDGANLYFETDGFLAAATTDVVIFLSDGAATLANSMTSAPTELAGATLPFSAELAIDYETASNTVRHLYANDGFSWSAVAATDAVYGSGFGSANLYGDLIATGGSSYQVVASNALQALVPIGVLPSNASGVVYVAGEIVTGVGGVVSVLAEWPKPVDTWVYVADVLSSCETPVSSAL